MAELLAMPLQNLEDRTIAAAGKHRVAAFADRRACLVSSGARACVACAMTSTPER